MIYQLLSPCLFGNFFSFLCLFLSFIRQIFFYKMPVELGLRVHMIENVAVINDYLHLGCGFSDDTHVQIINLSQNKNYRKYLHLLTCILQIPPK